MCECDVVLRLRPDRSTKRVPSPRLPRCLFTGKERALLFFRSALGSSGRCIIDSGCPPVRRSLLTRAGSPPLGTSIVTEFGDCVSQQQDSYRLIIYDIDKRTFVLDTGVRTDHMAQHTERHIALLRSARQYTVELTVYSRWRPCTDHGRPEYRSSRLQLERCVVGAWIGVGSRSFVATSLSSSHLQTYRRLLRTPRVSVASQ